MSSQRHRFTTRVVLAAISAAGCSIGCSDLVTGAASGPLVKGERGITSIAADDFFVYWSTASGSIKRILRDGGDVETLATGQRLPDDLALDGTHVFWTTADNGIVVVPKRGGEPVRLAIDAVEVRGLAADDASVYWTAADDTIKRVPKAGGDLTTMASGLPRPGPLRAAWNGLLWGNEGASVGDPADGSLMRMAFEGGSPATILDALRSPRDLAVGERRLFWIADDHTVSFTDLAGASVTTIASPHEDLHAVAGDDAGVYWTSSDGTVTWAALDAGEPVEIATGPIGKVSLALDLDSIYWANSNEDALMVRLKD